MITGSWRITRLRGLVFDRRSSIPCLRSAARPQLQHYDDIRSQSRSIIEQSRASQRTVTRVAKGLVTHDAGTLVTRSIRASAASERQYDLKSNCEDSSRALELGRPRSTGTGFDRKRRRSVRNAEQIRFHTPQFSGRRPLTRSRLSWAECRLSRRQKYVDARRITVWNVSTFARKRPLKIDTHQAYSPQIRKVVAKAIPLWYSESQHIFKAIQEKHAQSHYDVPKDLLQFRKFLTAGSTTTPQDGTIYRAWLAKSWRGKAVWWRHALYYSLLYCPIDALRIAVDISNKAYLQIPGSTIADVLLLYDGHCVVTEVFLDSKYDQIIPFYEAARLYLGQYTKREGRALLPWCIIRRLSQALDGDRLKKLVAHVVSSKTEYNIYTKLSAIYRYLELNRLSDALDLFQTFTQKEMTNRAVQGICVVILRLPWQVDDLKSFREQLLAFMLEKGLKPRCVVRNVMLQNHLEARDKSSAWEMLDAIRKNGWSTSEYTYALFLKHTQLSDSRTINALYHIAKEDGVLDRSKFLAGYFIEIAVAGRFLKRQNSFQAVLALYKTLFNTIDLEDFGIVERSEEFGQLMTPSSFALQWMLVSWIYENRRNPQKLTAVYNNYLFHLRNNHPRIALLASAPHISTSFVLAFGSNKSHLHMCSKVLQDMIRPEKPIPLPSYDPNMAVPEYEKFLEPEDPNEIVLGPGVSKLSPTSEHGTAIPAYEQFLEPKDPAEVKMQTDTSVSQPSDVWSFELDDLSIFTNKLRSKPFSYRIEAPAQSTWNAFLSVLLQHKELDSAERVITAMQAAGHEPDEMTWKTVVRQLSKQPASERTHQISERLRSDRPKPDTEINNRLLSPRKSSNLLQRFVANLKKGNPDVETQTDTGNVHSDEWMKFEYMELDKEAQGSGSGGVAAEMQSRF